MVGEAEGGAIERPQAGVQQRHEAGDQQAGEQERGQQEGPGRQRRESRAPQAGARCLEQVEAAQPQGSIGGGDPLSPA